MIEINNVNFGYNKTPVLVNVNQKIDQGDFVALVGPNGAGKSTLIKLMLQINTGHTGNISINGRVVNKKFDYSSIGYVAQKSAAFNRSFPATVLEVVMGGTGNKKKALKALETVGMEGIAKSLIGNLSGGQVQRVFIAKALLSQPKILILDEPTVGIDYDSVKHICALLNDLNKNQGITILMTTHNLPNIQNYINKILFLDSCGHTTMYDPHNMTKEDVCKIYDHPMLLHSGGEMHKTCDCDEE